MVGMNRDHPQNWRADSLGMRPVPDAEIIARREAATDPARHCEPSWYPLILDVLQRDHPAIYREVKGRAVDENAERLRAKYGPGYDTGGHLAADALDCIEQATGARPGPPEAEARCEECGIVTVHACQHCARYFCLTCQYTHERGLPQ